MNPQKFLNVDPCWYETGKETAAYLNGMGPNRHQLTVHAWNWLGNLPPALTLEWTAPGDIPASVVKQYEDLARAYIHGWWSVYRQFQGAVR